MVPGGRRVVHIHFFYKQPVVRATRAQIPKNNNRIRTIVIDYREQKKIGRNWEGSAWVKLLIKKCMRLGYFLKLFSFCFLLSLFQKIQKFKFLFYNQSFVGATRAQISKNNNRIRPIVIDNREQKKLEETGMARPESSWL